MKTDAASRLKEIISRHYDIGELVDYEQLHLGYVNVSYVIETVVDGKREKYFLRRYKVETEAEEIEFEHSVINHLLEKSFELVARVIHTRDGKTYVERLEDSRGVFYAIFDFLPGEDSYTWVNPACNDEELRNAAAVLAQFHNAVFDLNPAGKRHEPRIIELLPRIAENVETCAKRAGKREFDAYFLAHRGFILETVRRTLRAISEKECQKIVRQVIHCDYHPGNLKFQDNEIIGLFDFDWSKVDARCFDVAHALTYFCTKWASEQDGYLQLDKVATFLRSYQDTFRGTCGAGPLSEAELKYLPHLISASNIYVLNWTITDFYGSEVDPGEYLIYLRHGVHIMRWLENKDNWDRLEETVFNSG
jgi:homoserine kinase type II